MLIVLALLVWKILVDVLSSKRKSVNLRNSVLRVLHLAFKILLDFLKKI